MAGANLGSAYGRITIDAGGVRRGIDQVKQAFDEGGRAASDFGNRLGSGVRQGANVVKQEASKIGEGVKAALPDSLGTMIGLGIGGAIAGGLSQSLAFVKQSLNEFAKEGVALSKLQQQTGMAAKDLSALRNIARESDISVESLSAGMMRFSRVIVDTKGPNADLRQELMLLSDQFSRMQDGPEKADLAMQMFGRSGAELIPILNQGSEALQQYMAQLEAAGVVMDEKAVAAANRLDDANDRVARSWQRISMTISTNFAPAAAVGAEATANLVDLIIASNGAVDLNTLALKAASDAGYAYAAGANAAGNAAAAAVPSVTALTKAAQDAYVAYGLMRKASADWAAANNNVASAGKVLGGDADKQFDRAERQRMAVIATSKAYAEQARIMQNADRESARLTTSYGALNTEQQATAKWANDLNERLDGTTKSAGGAAKATQDLAEAQDLLQKRTQGIGSAMGSNLGPMSDTEKFQKAWAIATGETTLAEVEQEAAVKSVMKALEEKRISQQEALATLLALRGGLIDTKQAMAEAGDPSKQFSAEVESIRAMTEGAIEKVRGLSLGINTLPTGKTVGLNINVYNKEDLQDAWVRWQSIQDRNAKLSINIAGMPELNKVYEILVMARGGTPLPGGSTAPGVSAPAPADSGTSAGAADTGVTKGGGSDAHDRHGPQGAKTIVFQVGDDVVAKATVNGKGAVGVARKNAARSWRN